MALKSIEHIPPVKVDAGPITAGTKIDISGEPIETDIELGSNTLTYDQICNVIFKTSFWICKNEKGFFND